ncbi:hypothetical protein GXW78_08335 [Roseomonas terrae]|uniref:Uncharacterized protein n=1 Tax=Neoroseomonas terrae TaxID=424799 RepID=A0ABS5EF65_9PROT|nr:hypothetical protein [Neoroseomonas terrae]MBR0649666.1 hypothetical protein [Neoroseomonas terrae]
MLLAFFLALPASAQDRDDLPRFDAVYIRAARLVTLAPLCGARDEAWARQLEQGLAAIVRPFPPEAQWRLMATAAFSVTVGTRLYETYGREICNEADDITMPWRDADDLVRIGAEGEPPLPTLPPAVILLGWQSFAAQLAVRCDRRDRRWGAAAQSAVRRAIAMHTGLAEDPESRRIVSRNIVGTARVMANLFVGTHGAQVCTPSAGNATLHQVDAMVTEWRRLCPAWRPDATCQLGAD